MIQTSMKSPIKKLSLLLAFWLLVLLFIGGWWSHLLVQQADLILEFQQVNGVSAQIAEERFSRTQRMVIWEMISFIVLIFATSAAVFWILSRDLKRTQALQAFFASLTHELKTPLTSIRLQAEAFEARFSGNEKSDPLIQRLMEDTSRLESQVERTLELARIEGGGRIFPEPVSLKSWCESFLWKLEQSSADRLKLKCLVGDHHLKADPFSLQMILRNLCENSLNHSGKPEVQVSLESREESLHGKKWVILLFKDQGKTTVSQEDRKHLGELFYKLKGSKGTGVGLYLVRSLMDKMGGKAKFLASDGFPVELWFEAL